MKNNYLQIVAIVTLLLTSTFCFLSPVSAEKTGAAMIGDAAVAVNVIVEINKKNRLITLKTDEGKQVSFTAGPEVRNFDQLKRGDLVLLAYYSGFAIALEPKGSDLETRVAELTVSRTKEGEKPGAEITANVYVLAKVAAVDTEYRVVVLEGPEKSLALKVADDVNMAQIEVGQEVEALYTESYVISVISAPKVSGAVEMKTKSVAIGIGVAWGQGSFTMYDETNHAFTVKGLTVLDAGISSVEATGEIYNLVEAKDLEGLFVAGEAGVALIGGGSGVILKNNNGVVMKLKSSQKGVRLTLAGEGLKIKLK